MAKLTVREELEIALNEQLENSYNVRPAGVIGLTEVERGYNPPYPVTVYQLSGDDTSGIAGLLYPSEEDEDQEFIATLLPSTIAEYWEYDETLKYEKVTDEDGNERIMGDSWTAGEVVWDGVAGGIDNHVHMLTEVNENSRQQQNGKGTLFNKSFKANVTPHVRREERNSLTSSWDTYHPNALRDHRQTGLLHLSTMSKNDEREFSQGL